MVAKVMLYKNLNIFNSHRYLIILRTCGIGAIFLLTCLHMDGEVDMYEG